MKRFIVFCGVLGWITLVSATILPIHVTFVRTCEHTFFDSRPRSSSSACTVINWMLFQGFVLVWSYMREQSDRRTYTLRAELKGGPPPSRGLGLCADTLRRSVQFKAKQKAQMWLETRPERNRSG